MKALSIYPDATMEIFMGDKTVECRTWKTDYRGDLLICAGSKKEPGLVNGYAYFVVPLLDVLQSQEDLSDMGYDKMYEWILGAPKLIQPIRVRGQLFLFDVDDALIHYIPGGDLGTFPTVHKANEFRKAYTQRYLTSLFYRPDNDTLLGGLYGSMLGLEKKAKPPVDMPLDDLFNAIPFLNPSLPVTTEIAHVHPELELGLAHYPSQKAAVFKWLQGLTQRNKTSGLAAYNQKQNLLILLWLAEALGESKGTLKRVMGKVFAKNTMPERCEAFRRAIPLERLKELVGNPQAWQIDPALKPFLDFEDGRPCIAAEHIEEYHIALRDEGIRIMR